MYCKNCGTLLDDNCNNCPNCGTPVNGGNAQSNNQFNTQNQTFNGTVNTDPAFAASPLKSKMAAGLLGIFLGGFGIHNFYLGFNNKGIIQLILTICSCGFASIWGFIEGILILTGSINTDAAGRPLSE